MQYLPYGVMLGALILSLVAGVIGGGLYWIVPAVIWPIVLVYALFDRRLKKDETREERLAAEPDVE